MISGFQLPPESGEHLDRMYFDAVYRAHKEATRQRREFRAHILAEVDTVLRDERKILKWLGQNRHWGRDPEDFQIVADYIREVLASEGDE